MAIAGVNLALKHKNISNYKIFSIKKRIKRELGVQFFIELAAGFVDDCSCYGFDVGDFGVCNVNFDY